MLFDEVPLEEVEQVVDLKQQLLTPSNNGWGPAIAAFGYIAPKLV